jgi:hypothetical protein
VIHSKGVVGAAAPRAFEVGGDSPDEHEAQRHRDAHAALHADLSSIKSSNGFLSRSLATCELESMLPNGGVQLTWSRAQRGTTQLNSTVGRAQCSAFTTTNPDGVTDDAGTRLGRGRAADTDAPGATGILIVAISSTIAFGRLIATHQFHRRVWYAVRDPSVPPSRLAG